MTNGFVLREVLLIIKAGGLQALESPIDFFQKVRVRLNEYGLKSLSVLAARIGKVTSENSPVGFELVQRGHLSDGIRVMSGSVKTWNWIGRKEIEQAKRRLRYLESRIDADLPRTLPKTENPTTVIALITNSLPHTQSGYTLRTHSTFKAMIEAGWQMQIFTRPGYPALIGKLAKSEIEEVDGVGYRRLIPEKWFSDELKRAEFAVQDVVQKVGGRDANVLFTTTDFRNGRIAVQIAKKLDLPLIYEVRGELENTWAARQSKEGVSNPEKSQYYQLSREREMDCLGTASAVVALSQVSKDNLVRRGVSPEKIFVIPNAISSAQIGKKHGDKARLRERLRLPNRLIIGSISSIVSYEGFDILLKAIVQLPEVHCVLVGYGEDRERLERLARELGVHRQVKFAGKIPHEEVEDWYEALDIFILPRLDLEVCRNVTPIKPLLAMAKGVPVIASDLPAIREITGGLAQYIEPGNVSALADAVRLHAKEAQSESELIEWARQHTWDKNVVRYKSLINWLQARE